MIISKNNFKKHIIENYYNFPNSILVEQFINNILDYAGNLDEVEQYNFLCDLLPNVPEVDIRNTYFNNEESEINEIC